jgi:predicted acetyltransferase
MKYPNPTTLKTDNGWKVEVFYEGKSVSRLWIIDRQMRIGAGVVSVAGIAGVGTNHEHRNRGLAIRVLRRSLKLMRKQGYDTSVLFGTQDFYHRVGFATCFPEHDFSVDTRVAEGVRSALKTRPMKPSDLVAVRKIYEHQNQTATATVVRDRTWLRFPMGSGFDKTGATEVVYAPGTVGKVLGYVLYDETEERCRAAEVGGSGAQVQGAIIRFLGQRAVQLKRERVSASVASAHPFSVYCRSLGCHDETRYPANGGPMGRIIDLPGFLAGIAPELALRWPDGAPKQISLQCEDGGATLTKRRGVVTVKAGTSGRSLRVKDAALMMQLAMGFRHADDAIGAGTLSGTRPQLALARELFPLRVAYMSWPDRF